jgi:hypothetical protein
MKNTQEKQSTQFSSNAIRLSVWQWLLVAVIMTVLAITLPPAWRSLEAFSPPIDYRIPYDSSEDYWLFKQYCRSVCDQDKTLVIGDSVIWGHYVDRDQTLSHYLNQVGKNQFVNSGTDRFVNLGLDGSHPMALYGLIKYYGKAVKEEKVILHMNLLWLSSQEADLQTEKEFPFNHPRLVPQFKPHIPCYTESASGRIGIIIERSIPMLQLVRHLQVAHFENTNLPLWTLENPYSNPLARVSISPLRFEKETDVKARSRTTGNQVQQSLPWVEFETSLQWRAFQRSIELLEDRGNDVFVAVGPLNEHVLTQESILKYKELLKKAENRLKKMNVSHSLLPLLPEHLYADTSHPLPKGYALLAEHIWNRLE